MNHKSKNSVHLIHKNVWGSKRFYPNCDLTNMICGLLKKPTIPIPMMEELKHTYGYTVYIKFEDQDEYEF